MANIQEDIQNKLNYLDETKQEIKQALKIKGQPVTSSTPFREYANMVNNITTGIETGDATATAADIIKGKTAYARGEKLVGEAESPELITTQQDAQLNLINYSPLGTVPTGTICCTSCIVRDKLISISTTDITIFNYVSNKTVNYKLSDIFGNTPSIKVISIGANNPNGIGKNYYYILLSCTSNDDYLVLYNYDDDTIYTETFNGCKSKIVITSGSSTLGKISQYHCAIAYTNNVAEGAGGSSFGAVSLCTFNASTGSYDKKQIYGSDGFWAPYPEWCNNDRVLAVSRFYNAGQWTGQKVAILFNADLTQYKTTVLQNRSTSPSTGYVFSYDMSLCLKELDLYKVNYDSYANTLSLSLLQANALKLDGFTTSNTLLATYGMYFTSSNEFLILKNSTTQISLFKLINNNFELITQYNVPTSYFLIRGINVQDTLCTCGINSTIISLDQTQQAVTYLQYGDKKYWNYDDNLINTTSDDVLTGKKFIGSNNIMIGSMPNNDYLNYMPTNKNLSIPSGFTNGGTVYGDENLDPLNIISGKSIFGVQGQALLNGLKLFKRNISIGSDDSVYTLSIYNSNKEEIPLIGNSTYYINWPNIIINVILNGINFGDKNIELAGDSYLDITLPNNLFTCNDNYSSDNIELTSNMPNINISSSPSGNITFDTISSIKGLYTDGNSYISYTFSESIDNYDIQFNFYKSNTAAFSRVCYIMGPNYEIEIKGASNSIYWGSDYSAGWLQNQWNTLKLHKNGDSVELYMNDRLIATRTYTQALTGIRFGQGSSSSNRFTGYFSNVSINAYVKNEQDLDIQVNPVDSTLEVTSTDILQTIPISQGITQIQVNPIDITKTQYYNDCNELAKSILGI